MYLKFILIYENIIKHQDPLRLNKGFFPYLCYSLVDLFLHLLLLFYLFIII